MILHTERLRLEPCSAAHYDGLRAVNTDPVVMRFLGGPQSPQETRDWIARAEARWAALGYSWWTILRADIDGSTDATAGATIGAGCIQHVENDPAQPVEIGWRLLPAAWGKGYAIEAARAMAGFAFNDLGLARLYANADPDNAASIRVMERLGMRSLGLQQHYGGPCATYVLDRP